MSAPFPLPDTCSLYRPFGAGTPTYTDLPCRIVPNLTFGRGGTAGPTYLMWTHWIDFEPSTDVRDGCTRSAGSNYVSYADGDEIRASLEGRTYSWVVIWVEDRFTNTDNNYCRAYCVRDSVSP